jgi:hypothetical protein
MSREVAVVMLSRQNGIEFALSISCQCRSIFRLSGVSGASHPHVPGARRVRMGWAAPAAVGDLHADPITVASHTGPRSQLLCRQRRPKSRPDA